MRARLLVLASLVLLAAAAALVRGRAAPGEPTDRELLAPDPLARLLARDARAHGAESESPGELWRALLAPPWAEPTPAGPVLRLGRVLAFPTAAFASASTAGELLALEAEGDAGPLGIPLWRAILDGPATEGDGERTLKLYGCRHSADAPSAPALEDSYTARLSLAAALRAHAETSGARVALAGEHHPVKGGVNFEVQLVGAQQVVRVTFDGRDAPVYRARRELPAPPSNDAQARASLVAALRALAASDASLGALTVEGVEAAVADGVDVRLERYDDRLAVVVLHGPRRLSAWMPASGPAPE